MTRAEQIVDEVRRLPKDERMDVLQGVVELVAPALNPEEEKGLIDVLMRRTGAISVDGAAALSKQRGRARGAG